MFIGKRTLRSLIALATVFLASAASPGAAVAAEEVCTPINALCIDTCASAQDICGLAGCADYICDQSYQCGFFQSRLYCSGNT